MIFPPRCGGCRRLGTWWCGACAATLRRPPIMEIGGIPLLVTGLLEGSLQRAIHVFKYRGRPQLGRPLGREMAEVLAASGIGMDGLTFVPLHRRRQRERGFNQAELLARAVGRERRLPVLECLHRVHATPAQVGLSGQERRLNLQSAFLARTSLKEVSPAPSKLALVDDVCTTGTTLAAARVALQAVGVRLACYLVLASPQTLTGAGVTFPGSPGVPNLVRGELK